MNDSVKRTVSRRGLLVGAALLLVPAAVGCATDIPPTVTPAPTGASVDPATQAPAKALPTATAIDFVTGAIFPQAEAEGTVMYYGHDNDAGIAALLAGFRAVFPRIKTAYVRMPIEALYPKLIAERTARAFQCDVLQMSDMASVLDLQKNGGYAPYASPQAEAYNPEYLSKPFGSYVWAGVAFAGLAFSTTEVTPGDAPASWKDINGPTWTDFVSVHLASSGSQFLTWYMLRSLFGKDFWKEFGKQKPKPFASNGQLFDRLSKGYDRLCALAEYPGYVANKDKGSAIDFVVPSEGVSVVPSILGIAGNPPHPEAAKLFMDWAMSARGQAIYQSNSNLGYGSVRAGAPAMPAGVRMSDLTLLFPSDWEDFLASQKTFVEEWNAIIGM